MTIASTGTECSVGKSSLPLCPPGRRARFNGQIKSIINILILMLCHMAANASNDRLHFPASPSQRDSGLTAPLIHIYVIPQPDLPSVSAHL